MAACAGPAIRANGLRSPAMNTPRPSVLARGPTNPAAGSGGRTRGSIVRAVAPPHQQPPVPAREEGPAVPEHGHGRRGAALCACVLAGSLVAGAAFATGGAPFKLRYCATATIEQNANLKPSPGAEGAYKNLLDRDARVTPYAWVTDQRTVNLLGLKSFSVCGDATVTAHTQGVVGSKPILPSAVVRAAKGIPGFVPKLPNNQVVTFTVRVTAPGLPPGAPIPGIPRNLIVDSYEYDVCGEEECDGAPTDPTQQQQQQQQQQ